MAATGDRAVSIHNRLGVEVKLGARGDAGITWRGDHGWAGEALGSVFPPTQCQVFVSPDQRRPVESGAGMVFECF